jgi:hypothetical protein
MRLRSISLIMALLLVTSRAAFAAAPPCACLQELWVNYPGPFDLYIALVKQIDCNDEPEEALWYGTPYYSTLPQICEDGDCQPYDDDDERVASVPGHGQSLVGIKAWEMFRVGIEAAVRKAPGLEFGEPSYHNFSQTSLPTSIAIKGDLLVMAIPMTVHAKGSPIDGKTYYFCVQIDSANGLSLTNAAFEKGKAGSGSQLHIKYRVKGETRNGLVWLK